MAMNISGALDVHMAAISRLRAQEESLVSDLESVRQKIETMESAAATIRMLFDAGALESDSASAESPRPSREMKQSSARAEDGQPIRARIGDQRYLMMFALRQFEALDEGEIAEAASLPARRVRDQMRSDMEKGVVDEQDGKFVLTEIGRDLMARYEEYRREVGKPLPTLPIGAEGPPNDLLRDDAQWDEPAFDSQEEIA